MKTVYIVYNFIYEDDDIKDIHIQGILSSETHADLLIMSLKNSGIESFKIAREINEYYAMNLIKDYISNITRTIG